MSLERLAELARREEEAVAGRRWEELIEIRAEQQELLASMRGRHDASARPVLEAALARALATERALIASLAETQGAIERLRAGRRAVRGYDAGGTVPRALEIRV